MIRDLLCSRSADSVPAFAFRALRIEVLSLVGSFFLKYVNHNASFAIEIFKQVDPSSK